MSELPRYRVWPDGTTQELPAALYDWMSDDFVVVNASDEDDAIRQMVQLTGETK